jgi:transcriptional regulator with XRE-family HTH domain
MPSSPSSNAQQARERLGGQLRELRTTKRIKGREFARAAGWRDATLVSAIERGRRTITADHIRLWCRVCDAPAEREAELLAEQQAAATMWQTHAQLNRAGLKGRQERLRDEYWQVRRHRVYQTKYIPGLLQTEALTSHYLTTAREEQHLTIDDVPEAVTARMQRQQCLDRPDAVWLFLLEEDVLWYRPASVQVHREQLEHLLVAMRRPTVSLAIIARDIHRHGINPEESFTMSELPGSTVVTIELVSGDLNFTQPYEVRMYLEAWERLQRIAVVGDLARALITKALQALDQVTVLD